MNLSIWNNTLNYQSHTVHNIVSNHNLFAMQLNMKETQTTTRTQFNWLQHLKWNHQEYKDLNFICWCCIFVWLMTFSFQKGRVQSKEAYAVKKWKFPVLCLFSTWWTSFFRSRKSTRQHLDLTFQLLENEWDEIIRPFHHHFKWLKLAL